jgi:hypothetical protein
MTSPLENLARPGGSLTAEPPDTNEFIGLRNSGLVRIIDADNPDLSLESRFDLAYNAAHALSLAALRHKGFRSSNRYIVFQILPHTLGLGPNVWRILSMAHDKRNPSEYQGFLDIDERFVLELVAAVETVADAVEALDPP